ncbi:terpene synthase family protein [Streptomyces sp. 8N616]|uniref:terpene synthase family protein n=1 Tax=Streptomyces sp. 8N616 TaxID=3457414 RepID=UPI003FD5E39B
MNIRSVPVPADGAVVTMHVPEGRQTAPQKTAFDIPFPDEISSDVAAVHERSLTWLCEQGMLRSEAAVGRMDSWRLTELAGRFHPHARGDDLLLGADVLGFFFLFDDQFDDPGGLRMEAVAASKELISLLHLPPGTPPSYAVPATVAWADIWARSCQGMSDAWRTRAAREWQRYFVGNLEESVIRSGMPLRSVEGYLRLRRLTIGTTPVYDMSERTQHFEIPREAFHTHHIQAMRDLATDVVTLCNDVASAVKENAREESLNSVLFLQRRRGLERDDAVASIQSLVRTRTTAFRRLYRRTPEVCDALDLTQDQREMVDRYLRTALMSVMRGNYDWQQRSLRYSAVDARPGNLPSYLENLVGDSLQA